MNYRAYVINMDSAKQRWAHMVENLELLNIPYTRIPGVAGDKLQEPITGYSSWRYSLLTGKVVNKREIGCYFSHINAFREFLNTSDPYALILEDDVTLPENTVALLEQAIKFEATWDMIRLTSSREGNYLRLAELQDGYHLTYNLAPLKNTGAYFINRHAARCCADGMLPMQLPYDVALDRDWAYGFQAACITPFPVKLEEEFPGQIPKAKRITLLRATSFHLFHLITGLQRKFYRSRNYQKALARIKGK